MIHLDTSFLVDLLRERAQGTAGPASRFLAEEASDEDLWVSVFVACELLQGAEMSARPALERERVTRTLSGVQVTYPDEAFPSAYARIAAWLERRGQRIGVMDALIAAAALQSDAALATRNVKEFSRVPGLRIASY